MTQATTHNTTTTRRAHPAVVRAALRVRNRRTVPSQITLPGGTVRTLQYDGLLRLKTLAVKDPGQSQVMNYQYGYDLTGNIVSKATEQSTTNYSYDTLDHLTGATYTNQTNSTQTNETYTYDPLANRTSSASTASYTYNANNQLTAAGSIRYTYDENGNTLSQTDANNAANTRSYVYDTDNRLIEVHDASNAIIATYRYDPFGRRISKTLHNGSQSNTTYYFYSAEGLIAEADSNGQLTKSYGYAPGSTFSTNPLWMKVPASGTQTAATYYTYQNDHLGTPQKLLNQSGITVWSATYDAFGRATVDPSSTVSNSLRYPGQYEDAETGLYYNWMRYYDPATGRYATSDPIGLNGGINIYNYVDGNPVSFIDPKGLANSGPRPRQKKPAPRLGPRFPGSSCGAEGDPNNFPNEFSGQSIESACQNHDKCYADCSRSKSQCDTQFYHEIRRACFNNGSAVACNLASLGYYAAVALKGRDAFDNAREKCDKCSSK